MKDEKDRMISAENQNDEQEAKKAEEPAISATWAEDTIADIDDYIESQGIYLRQ